VRLVMERGLPIQRILVVTFTEAATSELRDRIRRRLQEAVHILEGAKGDEVLSAIVQAYPQAEIAARRLKNALRGFDEAAVFTIHGFCQRMLQDNAFESGQLFDTELVPDQHALLREIAEDFWRVHFYSDDDGLIGYALEEKLNVEVLTNLLHNHAGKPFLRIVPPAQALPVLTQLQQQQRTLFEQMCQQWPQVRAEIGQLLASPALNRQTYKHEAIPTLLAFMDSYLNSRHLPIKTPQELLKFSSAFIQTKTKKNNSPPHHPLFDLCQALLDNSTLLESAYKQHLIALKRDLFSYAEIQLKQRKQQRNIMFFEDLLRNLHHALSAAGGALLSAKIRRQFPAALIDEFQDTDPLQYEIFHRIYSHQNNDIPLLLFLIGDPKQAIYSFRGADIFAYLRAVRDADSNYTLTTNWRSSPDLIKALNAMFERVPQPFMFAEIAYQTAAAAKKSKSHPGLPGAALHLWHITRAAAKTEKVISKAWAETHVPELVASEIVTLLNADNGIAAGDIAVLTRTNHQAQMMQEALRTYRVPAVLYSRASLFASVEALEVHRILTALLEPQRTENLRAALCTEMLGWNGNQLYQLEADERAWEYILERFRSYQDLWLRRGFMPMFRRLLLSEDVPAHLLALADGERRLTNVLHLGEMLQNAWMTQGYTPHLLLQWLQERCARQQEEQDAFQLRLESDAHAVKVVTIHKSKGLQYPIVFVPFAWDGKLKTQKAPEFTFHPSNEADLVLDLGSPEQDGNRLRAAEEEQAENLRLFYVAVTRAQYRCYVIWGAFNDADTAAPAFLWHSGAKVSTLNDDELRADLDALSSPELINISTPTLGSAHYHPTSTHDAPQLQARRFKRSLRIPWQVSSFTSLIADTHHDNDHSLHQYSVESPEQDALMPQDDNVTSPLHTDIAAFPTGARAGEFFHALLENLDFRHSAHWAHHCENYLDRFGFERTWQPVVCANIAQVLHTRLTPTHFCLADIDKSQRLNELSFFYPHSTLHPKTLGDILAPAYGGTPPRFNFDTVRGFMRGFIDLVFVHEGHYYLVDYKSNRLGDTLAQYRPEALDAIMRQHHYILQYHIYTLALHLYLQARLPDYSPAQHLGGVFYLFLRGMSADSGIFYAQAPLEALVALSKNITSLIST
jgi:exodeoxyribonuclease V beta subunit